MRDVARKIGIDFGLLEDPDPPPAEPFSLRSGVVSVLLSVVIFATVVGVLNGGLDVTVVVPTLIIAVMMGGGQLREYRRHRRASRTAAE